MKKSVMVRMWLGFVILDAVLAAVLFGTQAEARVSKSLVKRLTAISKAYLNARNQVLVEGHTATTLKEDNLTLSYRNLFQQGVKRLLYRHNGMVSDSTPYTSFTTEVQTKKMTRKQELLILEATEHTKLYLGGDDPLTPEFTEYFAEHIFTFTRDKDSRWILVKDEVPFEPGMSEPQEGS